MMILILLILIGICFQYDRKHAGYLFRFYVRHLGSEEKQVFDYLYPRQTPAKSAWEFKVHQWKSCYFLLLAGVSLILVSSLSRDPDRSEGGILYRDDAFGKIRSVQLKVTRGEENDAKETYHVSLQVPAKEPDEMERKELFLQAQQELYAYFQKNEVDLTNLKQDLELPVELGDNVTVEWRSSDYGMISSRGILGDQIPKEGAEVTLTAILKYEKWSEQVTIPLILFPKPDTRTLEEKLEDYIRDQSEKYPYEDIILPEDMDGVSLSYASYEEKKTNQVLLLVLFVIGVVLAYANEDSKKQRQLAKRKESLERDYPELITKLSLLLRSGLTVPMAWKKIALDYEASKKQDRFGYEEVRRAALQLQSGVYEKDVYAEFGRRCELHNYRKLGTLLEENCRSGVNDLLTLLHEEAELTLESRLTLAKRKGEVARTKLLFPMLLLMLIVMIIVLVPAWLLSGM